MARWSTGSTLSGFTPNAKVSLRLTGVTDASGDSGLMTAQQQVLKRALAAVASRTVSSALDTLGARMGDAAPGSGLTLAGEPVRLGGSGTAAGPGYGAAYPPDDFDQYGFAGRFGGDPGGYAPGARSWGVAADRLFGASAFSLTLGAAPSGPARRDTWRWDAPDAAPAAARTWTTAQSRTADEPGRSSDESPAPGTIDPETTAMLDGRSSSDPEGDALSFSWTQVAGEPVTLRGADTPIPSFTAPAAPGPLTFRLTVTDKGGLSASAEVTLTVRDLMPGFGGAAPEPLALIVGREIDPVVLPAAAGGNGTLRYSLTSRPAGLAGLDFDPETRRLSGTPAAAGSFELTLRAADVDGDAVELAVPVTASENRAPVARIGELNRAPVARAEPPAAAEDARKTEAQPPPAEDRRGDRAPVDAGVPVWSVWGRGDLGFFEGGAEPGMDYRGKDRTGWLGVDAREASRGSGSPGRWVAGLAVSRGLSETDYGGKEGRLETDLTAVWPYGRWTLADGTELRGILGAGQGEARHVTGDGSGDGTREKSRLRMWAGSVGVRRNLPPVAGIALAVQGDASFARMQTAKGDEAVDGLRADARRLRGGVEASRRYEGADGVAVTPFLEAAARHDGGDGVTGIGLELAGGLRHTAPGVAVELRGRWLAAHTQGDTREGGASVTVRVDPHAGGKAGRGLSLSLSPRWGAGTGGADALWRGEMPEGASNAGSGTGSIDLGAGYGFAAFGDRFTSTPNLGFGVSGGGARDYRIGWRLTPAVLGEPGFEVNLDAMRREASDVDEPAEHGAMLRGTMRW